MVHVSEISAEKRINHPQDVLKVGQVVQAAVLAVDSERRNMRLSMKQLVPTSIDEYIAEHKPGDVVTGRVMEEAAGSAARRTRRRHSRYLPPDRASSQPRKRARPKRRPTCHRSPRCSRRKWKGAASASDQPKAEAIHAGQIRSFRIAKLDPETKTIELELA